MDFQLHLWLKLTEKKSLYRLVLMGISQSIISIFIAKGGPPSCSNVRDYFKNVTKTIYVTIKNIYNCYKFYEIFVYIFYFNISTIFHKKHLMLFTIQECGIDTGVQYTFSSRKKKKLISISFQKVECSNIYI